MTEKYIRDVMWTVTSVCDKAGIPEGPFWDWLGNNKFRTDDGDLSPRRSFYIQLHINELIKEFCKATEK